MRRGNEEVCVLEIVRPAMEDSESAEKTGKYRDRTRQRVPREKRVHARLSRAMDGSCRQPVMRGLDPRIHLLRKMFLRRRMDCRVKPGNESGVCACAPRSATNKCTKRPPTPLPCFLPVLYRERCNSNVSGRRGPCGTISRHHPS